jgi:hypothetical protein
MISSILKKALLISFVGHLMGFTLFSLSFGRRMPPGNYSDVSFQGAILNSYDLISANTLHISKIKDIFFRKPDTSLLGNKNITYPAISDYYFKPQAALAQREEKTSFMAKQELKAPPAPKKESVIMFYPPLPYHFALYFKDRQAVHMEIMFNITSLGDTNSIEIKRKISSGNLEADLLSMRYLNPYLFIQQKRFAPNSWHTVKIDLSPKK